MPFRVRCPREGARALGTQSERGRRSRRAEEVEEQGSVRRHERVLFYPTTGVPRVLYLG